jgi:hypothetical protein
VRNAIASILDKRSLAEMRSLADLPIAKPKKRTRRT